MVNDLPQKIPKLPKDLKQNVNWNQTLLNEEEVKLTPSISFLSIEVEHVDCHSSACLTQKKSLKKNCKTGTRVQSAVCTVENYDSFSIFTNLWILFFQTLNYNHGKVIAPYQSCISELDQSWISELEVMDNFNPDELIPQNPHVTLWGLVLIQYPYSGYLLCELI